jgi:hypothetical protein
MSNGAAGKGNLRLRSGKNYLPGGNVLSRLHKQLYAIACKPARGASCQSRLAPRSYFSDPSPVRPQRGPLTLRANVRNCVTISALFSAGGDDAMHTVDYFAISLLIGCMLAAAAKVLSGKVWQIQWRSLWQTRHQFKL